MNYADLKQLLERETDSQKKIKPKEALACMEAAAMKRGIRPEDWKPEQAS